MTSAITDSHLNVKQISTNHNTDCSLPTTLATLMFQPIIDMIWETPPIE